MDKLQKIASKWNSLETDIERWNYLLKNKNQLELILDDDFTFTRFHEKVIPKKNKGHELPELNSFDSWIGCAPGLCDLLETIGIEAEEA